MKCFPVILTLAALPASMLFAQGGGQSSLVQDLNRSYQGIKTNITEAAEKMPEADYSFQPTKEQRTFGQWVAHVADSQMRTCSGIAGSPQNLNAAAKTTKADLVAALKESFDACDAVYMGTTEANQLEPVTSFRGSTPRVAALYGNIAHDQECYGNMVGYLRLKDIVPPSTENMARGRNKMKNKKKE